jgi:hypothetical protein
MFSISILHNSASAYSAKYVRMHPIFMSVIFYHPKHLSEQTNEVERKIKIETSSGETKRI